MARIVELITFKGKTYGEVDEATENWLHVMSKEYEKLRLISMDGYEGSDGIHYRTILFKK